MPSPVRQHTSTIPQLDELPLPTIGRDSKGEGYIPMQYPAIDLTEYLRPGTKLRPSDWNAPEYEPAHYQPPVVRQSDSYLDWGYDCAADFCNNTMQVAKEVAGSAKTWFYEDNFELLTSIAQNQQDIRGSKSVFSGKGPDDLYSLSKSDIKNWSTFNFWKQTWFEGAWIGRSSGGSAVKVAELAPRILLDKAKEIHADFDGQLDALTRKAAVVLADERYDNVPYLVKLVDDLEELTTFYKSQMTQLELSSSGEGDTSLRTLQKALDKNIEEGFSQVSLFTSRKICRVDELKVYLAELFNRMDKISEQVRASYERVFLKLDNGEGNTRGEQLRNRIFRLVQEHHSLSQASMKKMDEYKILVEKFEHRRNGRKTPPQKGTPAS